MIMISEGAGIAMHFRGVKSLNRLSWDAREVLLCVVSFRGSSPFDLISAMAVLTPVRAYKVIHENAIKLVENPKTGEKSGA